MLARVSFPCNDVELWIREGVQNVIVANDVKGAGHFRVPGEKETVGLQIKFEYGVVPGHEVVVRDACSFADSNKGAGVGGGTQKILGGLV